MSSVTSEPARILIVDDTQKNIQLLGTLLKKENYLINVAYSGEQAIEVAQTVAPDLVLLDVMMPGIDGYQTCELLKQNPATTEIPVIFLTAKTEVKDIIQGFAVGAVDYVTKPFNAVVLLSRVRTHLNLRRALVTLEQKNQQLERMVVTDGLTGLFNHKFVFEMLAREVSEAKRYKSPLSIVMFDVDFFKKVNDNYGHQIGDEVLVKVSATIKSGVRQADIAGRYGGEEFLVILPASDLKSARQAAEKIRVSIEAIVWPHQGLKTTISGGVVQYSNETELELIDSADKLLYLAKQTGRNKICTPESTTV
ncbi:MAG: hypothetical protein A2527_08165 [Candidatus Lambdaproteobacteria bacterium RIFOXYD2_FULL_50_16]|uniref:diguanylate cyclase n=1 Tax=Candidatus Lambdaproteobacteria bacterium RIFOXYD2_FULL_50_16 TaxID=1817772 RepID=A0A1F6GAJ4_9PROT|nr:MAG: hypothetical protein A2527_08165 [Candidatus Lambdaproteobacteria bacterium RIFOXYD2_FULL_50_16]